MRTTIYMLLLRDGLLLSVHTTEIAVMPMVPTLEFPISGCGAASQSRSRSPHTTPRRRSRRSCSGGTCRSRRKIARASPLAGRALTSALRRRHRHQWWENRNRHAEAGLYLAGLLKQIKAREPLNKSAAALSGTFAPTYWFENLEIHKVFLQFPNLNLGQNPSLTALAI